MSAIIYIDGRNFHHGLEKLGLDGHCFDFSAYAKHLADRRKIIAIKYFGVRYPKKLNIDKHNRDDAFFKSMEQMGINIFEGQFLINQVDGKAVPREKGVDVRLATEMIFDSFLNPQVEALYVLSADTDLVPAIKEIKRRFPRIKFNNFSFNKLQAFVESCDYCAQIYPNSAKKFINPTQFPASIAMMDQLKSKFRKF